MLHPDIAKLLNEQINKELYSSYLYLAFSNYYADRNLTGFENWFFVQAQEERDHALLFRRYLLNEGECVTFDAVQAPEPQTFDSFKAPLDASLEHERFITDSINKIYTVASAHQDYRTLQVLNWFVKEQGEEEKNADDLIRKFDLFGADPKSLYMLNSELATRVYNPPSLIL
jgi:ferritin